MIDSGVDCLESLRERVLAAFEAGTSLAIHGGNTKRFLGRDVAAAAAKVGDVAVPPRRDTKSRDISAPPPMALGLDMRTHRGIVHYDPAELVLTARCGTRLEDIEAALAERGQMLACEPPHFGEDATFGGMVSAGLSGPRRPWAGAVRDFVLGCRVINGQGYAMRFGGEVIKNVAGYDVSRLLTGSFGCLALLTEISMKVLPKPSHQYTLCLDIDVIDALKRLAGWAREPLPITGACHDGSALIVRLEGGHGSVDAAAARLGGRQVGDAFWTDLREHRLPFFAGTLPLWRLSLPPATAPLALPGDVLVDWGGAQHWLRTTADAATIRHSAAQAGGSATAYRAHDAAGDSPFQPLSRPLLALHQRLKRSFDPRGVFNPGRLYPEL